MQMRLVSEADADDALLLRYGAGDVRAARDLTDRFLPLCYRVAVRMLGDAAEAEDMAQEAMIRLFRTAPVWRPGQAKVTSWLYRVTANLCLDRLRRRPEAGLDAAMEVADTAPSAAEVLTDRARLSALDQALATLPERQRLALVLRHIEGLGNPEIGAIMEINVEAVESLTARGKRALAHALAGQKPALSYEEG